MSQPIDNTIVNAPGITSSYTYVYNCSKSNNLSIQAIITGGNGTISLSASNDGVNYSPIPTASQAFTGTSDVLFTVASPAYPWISINVVQSSGTLAMVATIYSRSNTVVSN